MLERLQKALAEGGIGSRRECEQLILEGRVEVDRKVVTKLGTKVDPEKQMIRVDGETVKIGNKKYFAVNKPRGVLSTNHDPSGRIRVVDLIATDQRIYTVGRLDKDSEGLIIVTNDGDLANRLTHPKYGIEKTYLIQVEGHPSREQMESLQGGIYLADGFAQIKHFQFKRKQKNTTEIEIVLDEGRNREVRRLLAKIGHKVLWLRRIAIGAFFLSDIPPGGNRQLSSEEIALLSQKPKRKKQRPARKKPTGKGPTPGARVKTGGGGRSRGNKSVTASSSNRRPGRPKESHPRDAEGSNDRITPKGKKSSSKKTKPGKTSAGSKVKRSSGNRKRVAGTKGSSQSSASNKGKRPSAAGKTVSKKKTGKKSGNQIAKKAAKHGSSRSKSAKTKGSGKKATGRNRVAKKSTRRKK